MNSSFSLRQLPFGARAGISALLLVIAGGYVASLGFMIQHYEKKDEREGLTLTDLKASYHGIRQESPLRAALNGAHGKQYLESAEERQLLLEWLGGDRIGENYDVLWPGRDIGPADILDLNCVQCHARNRDADRVAAGEVSALALDNWPDVKEVAFTTEFHPTPVEILLVSTHTHALALPCLALCVLALTLLTRWPRWLFHCTGVLLGLGLLADFGSMWLARWNANWVLGIVVGGAAFGLGLGLSMVFTALDLWLPRRTRPTTNS